MRRDEDKPFYVGIKAKKHSVRFTPAGRTRYPFKAMIINDYFTLESGTAVVAVRNALKSFYKRVPNRKFTVRQPAGVDGLWIVRRVM